jgi:hypothetical protein
MMTSGVSPQDKLKEMSSTQDRLSAFEKRSDFVLQNQGPTVLPLAGHGNKPLKLVSRHNSVNLQKQLNQNEAAQVFSPFRANQYKETLPISPKV